MFRTQQEPIGGLESRDPGGAPLRAMKILSVILGRGADGNEARSTDRPGSRARDRGAHGLRDIATAGAAPACREACDDVRSRAATLRRVGTACAAALIAVLSGCAVSAPPRPAPVARPAPPPPAAVVEADEKMVEGCRFLGTVNQNVGIGTAAMAQRYALQKAAKLGATHLVFTEHRGANYFAMAGVTGRAYRCGATP